MTAYENTNLNGKTKHTYGTGYYHQSLKTLIERSQPQENLMEIWHRKN